MLSVDDISPSFMRQHRECCEQFMNWQTMTILSNITTFEVPVTDAGMEHLRRLKQHHAVAYISRFCRRAIDDAQRVVPTADNHQVQVDTSSFYCLVLMYTAQIVKPIHMLCV